MSLLGSLWGITGVTNATPEDLQNAAAPIAIQSHQHSIQQYPLPIYAATTGTYTASSSTVAYPNYASIAQPPNYDYTRIVCEKMNNGWLIKYKTHQRVAVKDEDVGKEITAILVMDAMNVDPEKDKK